MYERFAFLLKVYFVLLPSKGNYFVLLLTDSKQLSETKTARDRKR